MYSLPLIYRCLRRYVFVCVVDDVCAIALLSSLFFFISFPDDIICYSKKLGRICAADGETFEFLSLYNLWHFSSSLFSFPDVSILASSCCYVRFGRLSINHAKLALVFPLGASSSLTYVIIHCALPNFLLDLYFKFRFNSVFCFSDATRILEI